jgi:predicted amidohydrolase
MDKITIAYIQADLVWEDSVKNLALFNDYINKIEKADLVVLPEMFNTGFSMNVEKLAQPAKGAVLNWMKEKALENNFAIAGSLMVNDSGNYFNRFTFVYPCNDVKTYDKRHLFRMGNEHQIFSPGTLQPVFDYLGWKIRPLICYDLRFPVWSRNRNNYDLLIYVANWPAPRREVWKILLKARAIENQCYVLGVNRVGADGMNLQYKGDSMLVDYKGNVISELPEDESGIAYASICLSELQKFRDKFPVYLDADDFEIK